MKKYIVEFIGTFFLVLTICMTVIGGLENWAPLAIGVMLMVMVYAGGHISGAHFNPAVSVAIYLRGKLALGELPPYIFAQGVGAVVAALLSGYLLRSTGMIAGEALVPLAGPVLLAEFLGTFIFCYVFLHVYTAKGTAGNPFYGIAIGGALMGSIYVFGDISGGVFNPAVAAGVCTAQIISWSSIWIYLVASFVAGAVAAFVFNYVNGPE
ncbi:MAG TPA: aquaporin [Saprospiraceae bacterium]|nr:aquaporin [Saprospiraceae bacterium]